MQRVLQTYRQENRRPRTYSCLITLEHRAIGAAAAFENHRAACHLKAPWGKKKSPIQCVSKGVSED